MYQLLADLLLAAHVAFVAFVCLGGFACLRWPRLAAIHLPILAWGIAVEAVPLTCPLTTWENHFRELAGQAGAGAGVVNRLLTALLYPQITNDVHHMLAFLLAAGNVAVYAFLIWKVRRTAAPAPGREADPRP